MARSEAKSGDGLFIAVWLMICILLVFTASLSAARPPVNLNGYYDREMPVSASWHPPKREVMTANPEFPQ